MSVSIEISDTRKDSKMEFLGKKKLRQNIEDFENVLFDGLFEMAED